MCVHTNVCTYAHVHKYMHIWIKYVFSSYGQIYEDNKVIPLYFSKTFSYFWYARYVEFVSLLK